ncbi:MAG TPA: alpha/beta hydrolase [Saprospiraceae bacterium]|nr:alpha/beta hydrolase [Saprospiraceae bacterium]
MKIVKYFLSSLAGLLLLISLLFGRLNKSVDSLKDKYAQAPSAFVSVEGVEVHYRDEGNPEDSLPIVLIHGTGASLHTFEDWAQELKKEHRVLRMDLPAFGLTGPFPDRDYSIDHYVAFLEAFLLAKNIDRCILGGNSLGGSIAWRFALDRPDRVDKLILIDAAGYPRKTESELIAFTIARIPILNKILTFITPRFVVKSSVENVYADKSKVTKELIDRYYDLTLRAGNRQAFVDRMQVDTNDNPVEQISNIKQPTLILWGAEDALITTESAYRFQEDLPNDTLVILEQVGHVPMEESPGESLQPVLDFLR